MFKPPSPYYIYFRSKSNLAYFTFEDGWNSFWGHHTVCVCVCVCVRAYMCDVSMSLNLKYLTTWPKRKIGYKCYASGRHQHIVVINPLQTMTKLWRKRELTRLNNIINIHF